MEVKAKARFLRVSAKKVRLLIDVLRGEKVTDALEQLRFSKKLAKEPILKLLNSAVANAENNFELKRENLYIKKIVADEGPIVRRWRARAFGRSAGIRKRTTHLSIVLDELVATPEKGKAKKEKPVEAKPKEKDKKDKKK